MILIKWRETITKESPEKKTLNMLSAVVEIGRRLKGESDFHTDLKFQALFGPHRREPILDRMTEPCTKHLCLSH